MENETKRTKNSNFFVRKYGIKTKISQKKSTFNPYGNIRKLLNHSLMLSLRKEIRFGYFMSPSGSGQHRSHSKRTLEIFYCNSKKSLLELFIVAGGLIYEFKFEL